MDNEFLLMDRIQKIQQVVEKYGEENFYISFSGGKDSTVLSALVDMAIPKNTIPRVYANTGIEYNLILKFVEKLKNQQHEWELVMLKPSVPIKPMLEKEGYPFKSKSHSKWFDYYYRLGYTYGVKNYIGQGDKTLFRPCPKKLLYQFTDEFKNRMRLSDKCCIKMKEEPLHKWQKENNKPYTMTGIMRDEGGRRERANCLAFEGKKLRAFQPMAPLTKEWEEWFIKQYNIDISDIYKAPYNLERTGCKGCPFARYLQKELDTLEKYFPNERKQCEIIWKPVYEEYRRIGYRLDKKEAPEIKTDSIIEGQMSIFDFIDEK